MKKLELIVEDNGGLLEGYIEGVKSNSLISSSGKTVNELTKKLRSLIRKYQLHEGQDDKAWQKVDADAVEFNVKYNITAFFKAHDYLKASAIARRASMNTTLLSHYMTGEKHPGQEQVKRIELAVKDIAKELTKIALI